MSRAERRAVAESLDLDAIDAREKAAPAGPWYVVGLPWNDGVPFVIAGHPDPHRGRFVCDMEDMSLLGDEPEDWEGPEGSWQARQRAVAEFVAASRADVPQLTAEVRRLRAEVHAWRDAVAIVRTSHTPAGPHPAAWPGSIAVDVCDRIVKVASVMPRDA